VRRVPYRKTVGNEVVGRRTFLTAGAVAAVSAGALLEGCTDDEPSGGNADTAVGDGWERVRAEFALDPAFAHFAAFVLAGHPAVVRDAIASWRERLDADPDAVLHEANQHDDEVRRAVAGYLGVRPEEIALTDSTTMGLGLTYHGLQLGPNDHILTSTHDFYSTHESLRLAASRAGAQVEQIALYDDPAAASVDEIVSRVGAALRPETRVVALTWVHSSTGVKLPVREIADAIAEADVADAPPVFCLDAVHGFGAEAAGPNELGCDVFVSGTHKWLFGPRGTGLVWLGPDAGRTVTPTIPGFDATSIGNWILDRQATGPYGAQLTPGGYQAFEHRWAVADAFGFHREIGRDQVAARTTELATQLKDGLAEVSGVRVVTPRDPELSSGIVCCEMVRVDPGEAVLRLREEYDVIASVTPYRESYLRFGPSIVTMPEQVDALVEAVGSL
jgi:selenocysteine lyase/cysteine desulfurase